jgi:nitroreductase
MNVHEAIQARRTVRDFAPQAIGWAVLEGILEAWLRAATHDPHDGRRFVLVDDPEKRDELVRGFRRDRSEAELISLVDSYEIQDPLLRAMFLDSLPKQGRMIRTAAALIIPCFLQPEPLLAEKGSLHELNGFAEAWACLENMLIAAAAEGIYGVTKIPSTPAESDHIRRTLSIPGEYEIPCYLALGYPDADATRFEPSLPATRAVTFVNAWGQALS